MAVKDLLIVKKCLFICNGGSCLRKDADDVTLELRRLIKENGLDDEVHTVRTRCIGRCDDANVIMVSPDNIWFKNIGLADTAAVFEAIVNNKMQQCENFLYESGQPQINSGSIPTKYRKPAK